MKKTLNLGYMLFLSLSLFSCKYINSYEEGSRISIGDTGEKMRNKYRVESFTVNGVDSMEILKRYGMDKEWIFDKYNADDILFTEGEFGKASGLGGPGEKAMVEIIFRSCFVNGVSVDMNRHTMPGSLFNASWNIIKLRKNEALKISRNYEGNRYDLSLKVY
ncbi:MAG: hypothetical protein ACK40G_12160 [Cytophagaceae bacterium]